MKLRHKQIIGSFCLLSVFLGYFLTLLTISATAQSEDSSLLRYEVDEAFVGNLEHIIQISNPTPQRVAGGKLLVPIVRNETARHYVILYSVYSSVGQTKILNDSSGNMYAYWTDITIDRWQTFTIEMNYHVFSFGTSYVVNSSAIADYDMSSDLYKRYTKPEELIQSNDPQIVSKVQNLTGDEGGVHEKVARIYNFVVRHVRYAAQDDERGALWALENGVGDCSEYSYLFVALCRAAGIPARAKAGFAFQFVGETVEDGHMWAEYYLENYGWIPVDATWRLFDALDCRHFASIQSVPEDIPYTNYVFNNTAGSQPEDEQTVTLQSTPPEIFGDEFFIETIYTGVKKLQQAKFSLSLSKFFGAAVILSQEMADAERTLMESQIKLQAAIESWEALPELAQSNVAEALEYAEEAARLAWWLIVKAFTLLIGISTVILLVAFALLKRHQTRQLSN